MGPCGLMAMYTLRGTAGQGGFNISVIKTAVVALVGGGGAHHTRGIGASALIFVIYLIQV